MQGFPVRMRKSLASWVTNLVRLALVEVVSQDVDQVVRHRLLLLQTAVVLDGEDQREVGPEKKFQVDEETSFVSYSYFENA